MTDMKIQQAMKEYLNVNRAKRFSNETLRKDQTVIESFIKFFQQHGVKKHLTKADIRSYIVQLRDTDVKSVSINGYISRLKQFFAWCVQRKYITDNPIYEIVKLKEEKLLPSYVPLREMEKVFEGFETTTTLSVTQIVMFEVFYATGIRTQELVELHIDDVDIKNCLINVQHGKGGFQRIVPFPNSLVPVIRRYLQIREHRHFSSPYFFPNAHGAKMHRSDAYKYIKAILDTTSSRKKGGHTIRHSYASHLLARGANLKAIADLLGHRSYKTTVRYAHLDIEGKKAIFDKAHPKA